jgi:hypothetical protein
MEISTEPLLSISTDSASDLPVKTSTAGMSKPPLGRMLSIIKSAVAEPADLQQQQQPEQQQPNTSSSGEISRTASTDNGYQKMLGGLRGFFDAAKSMLRDCAKGVCDCEREAAGKTDKETVGKVVAGYANAARKLASISSSATIESMKMVETFNVAGDIPPDDATGVSTAEDQPMVVEISPEFDYDEALSGVDSIRSNVKELLTLLRGAHNLISTMEYPLDHGKRLDPNSVFFLVNELSRVQVRGVEICVALIVSGLTAFVCFSVLNRCTRAVSSTGLRWVPTMASFSV